MGILSVIWGGPGTPAAAEGGTQFQNTATGVAYVGSETCKMCHFDIFRDYSRTAMGRSMSPANDPEQLAKVPHAIAVYDKKLDRTFEILRQGSDLYQSEYQLDAQGREVFRSTYKLDYAVGADENGSGYIVRQGNYLVEAPLSYYAKTKSWELSPGFDDQDFGFTRPATAGCVACHSGRVQPVPGSVNLYRDPPFLEPAIGCENCHGPGQLHVAARMKGAPLASSVDPMIVNPAHLPGWLADNICMSCHQTGDARILQPGKSYTDFRPGTPLDKTVALFLVPFSRSAPPQDPLLQYYISMTLSKCYAASGRRLHCITCHDPHVEHSASEAPKYFRQKCLQCHSEKSCTLPLRARLEKSPPDDCAGCHMPKQNVQGISHSALTNHRILASPSEAFPDAAFHMTTPQLPDLVHLDAIPGHETAPAPLTLLKAYGELQLAHPEYRARYDSLLDSAALKNPENAYVLAALGRRKAAQGTAQGAAEAIQLLSKAIQSGWTQTPDYALLSELLARSGRIEEGIAILKRGIQVNPYDGGLYRMLVVQYADLKQYEDALSAVKQGLAIFPQDPFLREVLKKAEPPAAP